MSNQESMRKNPRMWHGKPVVRMHAMVKPIGPICNLNCEYCYYLSKQQLLQETGGWRISDEVLESFIRQYIEDQNYKEVVFSWQGGEPTLLGLDFFKRVVELEKRYCPAHMRCENDLQTNGTLIDDEWCAFLKENNFLVGLSIDGPRELHDHYRRDGKGEGSFDRAYRAAKLLRRHGVNFATLSCVNRLTAKHPLEVYRFLRDDVHSPRIQFIPIVEPKKFRTVAPQHWVPTDMPIMGSPAALPGTSDSVVEDWCVDPDDFGEFLCTIFDEWYERDLGNVYVHYFEAAVEVWMGRVSPLCTHGPMCGKGVALEHDGSVYACDHYVYPDYKLGNIMDRSIKDLVLTEEQEWFGTNKERTLPGYCRNCEYEFACFGECPKNRFIRSPYGEKGLNYLCSGWKRFYAYIDPYIQTIVRRLGHEPVVRVVSG